jgi:protein involved in polysaccharide export with SLBB domain
MGFVLRWGFKTWGHIMLRILPYLIFSLAMLVGCSSGPKNPPYEKINDKLSQTHVDSAPSDLRSTQDIPQFEETESLVAPGFLFTLTHPTDGKLQGSFRVGFDGILKLPYGVNIDVHGLTTEDVKKKVVEGYNKFFQKGAQNVILSLLRKEYYVEVRGLVKKSGQYLVKRKESIDKVIDAAGGLTGTMKQDFYIASIKQQDMNYSVSLNQYYENNALGTSFTWTGGDIIFVNNSSSDSITAPTVEILGGVVNPGKTLYKDDANIFYYIGTRGGVISNLGYDEAYLMRKGNKGMERIKFNITDMSQVPAIKPGDTILLNAERRTPFDKAWERTTQIASILTTICFLIIAL